MAARAFVCARVQPWPPVSLVHPAGSIGLARGCVCARVCVQRLELLVTLTLVQHRELQLPIADSAGGMRHTHFGAAVILLPSGLLAMIGEAMISVHNSARLPRQRDIPKLQVLRYVLGPIRALTDPGSHSEVADLGCRSCCDFAPMSRSETGAFGPAGVALASDVSRLQSAPVPFPLANAHSHFPCGPRFAEATRTGQDCQ